MTDLLIHFKRYGFSILCVASATWMRLQLHPILEDRIPFGTYFPAVLLCAWLAGAGPAVFSLLLSIVAAAHYFIEPSHSLLISNQADLISMSIFGLVGMVSIVLFRRLENEKQLAENRAREIQLLNQKLVAADRAKDEFISLLAHELRNPIAPLQSAAELLLSDDGDTQIPKLRGIFHRHLTHMRRLVDDLFDVSRYINGRLVLHREVIDLREPIRAALEMVSTEIDSKRHNLRTLLAPEPIWVDADPIRIAQICCNLLANAAKYTPHCGQITLIAEQAGSVAQIHVRDSGIGIANEMQESIFEPFNQIVSGKGRLNGGLGIGLTIVRKLVELHSGRIQVASHGLGCGSCFTVELPLSAPESLVARAPAPPSAEPSPAALPIPVRAVRRILIADDNVDAAETLRLLLERHHYRVRVSTNGVETVQLAMKDPPDVLLLDIGLPDIEGYEVAKQIRQRLPASPMRIVAVTGWGSDEHRLQSRQAGIDHHVVKPVILSELLPLLESEQPDELIAR